MKALKVAKTAVINTVITVLVLSAFCLFAPFAVNIYLIVKMGKLQ